MFGSRMITLYARSLFLAFTLQLPGNDISSRATGSARAYSGFSLTDAQFSESILSSPFTKTDFAGAKKFPRYKHPVNHLRRHMTIFLIGTPATSFSLCLLTISILRHYRSQALSPYRRSPGYDDMFHAAPAALKSMLLLWLPSYMMDWNRFLKIIFA